MSNPGTQILSLGEAEIIAGGAALSFTMHTMQGDFRVHIPCVDIGAVVAFFVGAAKFYEEQFGDGGNPGLPQNYAPIAAAGMGFGTTDDPDVIALMVRLHGFSLQFDLPNDQLREGANDLARILHTASAPSNTRQ